MTMTSIASNTTEEGWIESILVYFAGEDEDDDEDSIESSDEDSTTKRAKALKEWGETTRRKQGQRIGGRKNLGKNSRSNPAPIPEEEELLSNSLGKTPTNGADFQMSKESKHTNDLDSRHQKSIVDATESPRDEDNQAPAESDDPVIRKERSAPTQRGDKYRDLESDSKRPIEEATVVSNDDASELTLPPTLYYMPWWQTSLFGYKEVTQPELERSDLVPETVLELAETAPRQADPIPEAAPALNETAPRQARTQRQARIQSQARTQRQTTTQRQATTRPEAEEDRYAEMKTVVKDLSKREVGLLSLRQKNQADGRRMKQKHQEHYVVPEGRNDDPTPILVSNLSLDGSEPSHQKGLGHQNMRVQTNAPAENDGAERFDNADSDLLEELKRQEAAEGSPSGLSDSEILVSSDPAPIQPGSLKL
jgi:hypothetical protein